MVQSRDEVLGSFEFNFSDEQIQEALKKKNGRPSNTTKEIRDQITQAKDIKFILKDLGDLLREFKPVQPNPDSSKRTRNRNSRGIFSQLLKGDSRGFQKVIEKNSEEALSTAIKTGLPILGALAGIWIAEKEIKGFPPILHTGVLILNSILALLNALIETLKVIGDIPEVVGDIIQNTRDNLEATIEDPLGAGKEFIDKEVEKVQSLVDKAAKGDIIAIAELFVRGHPVTGVPIVALEALGSILGLF